MKKIFTFFVSAVLFNSAIFAQYDGNRRGDNNNDNKMQEVAVNNNRNYDRDDHHFGRDVKMKIDRINYEYDRKITSVENSFFLGRRKKEWMIARLEDQRAQEINYVRSRFGERDDNYKYSNDRDKGRRNKPYDEDRRNW